MREEEAIKRCLAKYGDNIKLRKFGGGAASMELPVPFLGFVQKAVAKVDDRGLCMDITLHIFGEKHATEAPNGIDITSCILAYLDDPKMKYAQLVESIAWKIKKQTFH